MEPNMSSVPPQGGQPMPSKNMARIVVVVVVVCVLAVAAYFAWDNFYRVPSSPAVSPSSSVSSSPQPSSLGNEIYSQPQNIIGSGLPQTNPFQ